MAYQNNIPQPTDVKSKSQSDILGNFAGIYTWVNVDHVTFDVTDQGKHKRVSLPVQSPAPIFATGEVGIYNFLNPTTTINEGYIHRQGIAGLIEVPFTSSKMSNTVAASCVNGWSYLPSSLLMKWGSMAAASATVAVTPTATSGGPNFSQVFVVYVTGFDTSGLTNFTCGQKTAADNTSGNFNAYCNNPSGTTVINYLVIGI